MNMQTSQMDKDWLNDLLRDGNDFSSEAWEKVKTLVVRPIFYKLNNIVRNRHLEQDELLNILYEKMCVQGNLTQFSFRCPLRNWMWTCLRNELFRLNRKNQPAVDPELLEDVLVDERVAPWEDVTRKEELVLVTKDFVTLWKNNPLQGYVLLLRTKSGMSSSQIQRLLNISSAANVDKITERGRKAIIEMASIWRTK